MTPKYIYACLLAIVAFVQTPVYAQKKQLSGEKREQFVQRALKLRGEENYNAAVQQLDSILLYNSGDAPILLFRGDLLLQSKKYQEAVVAYNRVISLKYETTIATINLSYALFMNHKPALALQFARKAWENNQTNSNAVMNYFNALLWNIKTREAGLFLEQQDSLLAPAEMLVLKARLYTTSGNFTEGLKYYDSVAKTYPHKYYIQEYAEVLLGKKEITASENVMRNARHFFSANEYQAYQQKLKAVQQQNTGTEISYFTDIAKNVRIDQSVWWQQADGGTYRFRVSGGYSKFTSVQQDQSVAKFGHVQISERWSKTWSGETDIHVQLIDHSNSGLRQMKGITGQQIIRYQPNDRTMVGVSYNTDILNYTTDLLRKNIRSNNIGYVTHLMMSGKTGFYSQGTAGSLSDGNKRFLFFGSFYHLFRTEPTLKGGINFSALHYSNNTVKTYFAPNRYLNTELFTDYSTALPALSKFHLQIQAAAGFQQIEKQEWNPAFRFQTAIIFRHKQLETSVKYQSGNVASNIGTGYQFKWVSFNLLWKW